MFKYWYIASSLQNSSIITTKLITYPRKTMPTKRKLSQTHPRLYNAEFVAITKYSKSTPQIKNFKPEDAAEQKLQSWKQKHSHKSMQPTDVNTNSHNYALWKCSKHSDTIFYLSRVKCRTRQKNPSKCPRCATRLK